MKKLALLLSAAVLALPRPSLAHCDTLDGPVVRAARKALETGKLNPVLAWVRASDEAEIKAAFARALAVRKLGPEPRALAETWFFETLVRIHRAGEGAPYTGLKPAGHALTPALVAADRVAAGGAAGELEERLVEGVRHGLQERLGALRAQPPPAEDVTRGRAWVAAYVPFVHWVESVERAAGAGADHHRAPGAEDAAPAAEHGH
jgi:hypothetical protein